MALVHLLLFQGISMTLTGTRPQLIVLLRYLTDIHKISSTRTGLQQSVLRCLWVGGLQFQYKIIVKSN